MFKTVADEMLVLLGAFWSFVNQRKTRMEN